MRTNRKTQDFSVTLEPTLEGIVTIGLLVTLFVVAVLLAVVVHNINR